jgi:hypothetical protein
MICAKRVHITTRFSLWAMGCNACNYREMTLTMLKLTVDKITHFIIARGLKEFHFTSSLVGLNPTTGIVSENDLGWVMHDFIDLMSPSAKFLSRFYEPI